MRGNKQTPSSKDDNYYCDSNSRSDHSGTSIMDAHGGMIRLGRFRIRLPSKQRKTLRAEDASVPSTASMTSWSSQQTCSHAEFCHKRPSIVVQTKQQQHLENIDETDSYSPLNRSMTLYRDAPESLSEALGDWLSASETLLRSEELHQFVVATCHVIGGMGDLAFRTALLPITLPIHVACSTTNLVVGGTVHVLSTAGSVIGSTIWSLTTTKQSLNEEDSPSRRKSFTCVKQQEYDVNKIHYLERLRLDYTPQESQYEPSTTRIKHIKTVVPKSDFLLRVADLKVSTLDDKGQKVVVQYVDLSCCNSSSPDLVQTALDRLYYTGLSLLAKHPTVRLNKPYISSDHLIDWKAESATAKLLREMTKLSSIERLHLLQKQVLVWSGKFCNERNRNALPAFLARGIVEKSPREFMELLWDNSRTGKYNQYCVSRTNALVLSDKVLEGAANGTKVVQSETRVPFTSLTVKAKCLMHVRPLEAPDVGFVILSRSLDSGDAGLHIDAAHVHAGSKNEILWGINVFRAVPSHPHLTDLTSLSQVSSSLVPTFMANRIGLMGVEDFFKNVRTRKRQL
ncbi:hypothetical protein MPSEU_000571800 [Mayamaea pseudoterrestris]|nr:hypothetical protein MPSEU_000571800 [Mayamaea pseudoterrestris]